MSKLTPEEKVAKKERIKAIRERDAKLFPFALLQARQKNPSVSLILEEGFLGDLVIRIVEAENDIDAIERYISLADLGSLARFIAALVARFNYLASDANLHTDGIRVETLNVIPGLPDQPIHPVE